MSPSNNISVQHNDFDIAVEYAALRRDSSDAGAIVTFTGLVRELTSIPTTEKTGESNVHLTAMHLEHYSGMTEKALASIVEKARRNWDIDQVRIVHRVGKLLPHDQIVFVGVSSSHRNEAFCACEFIMDFLKTKAPFWKKEITPEGEHWVEAKDSDDVSAQRWKLRG